LIVVAVVTGPSCTAVTANPPTVLNTGIPLDGPQRRPSCWLLLDAASPQKPCQPHAILITGPAACPQPLPPDRTHRCSRALRNQSCNTPTPLHVAATYGAAAALTARVPLEGDQIFRPPAPRVRRGVGRAGPRVLMAHAPICFCRRSMELAGESELTRQEEAAHAAGS
jgi:hypothetical protein